MLAGILTIVFVALLAYVLSRARSVPLVSRGLPRARLVTLGVGLAAVSFVGQLAGHDGTGPSAAALEWIGMALLGTVFLQATALLAVDLVTLFGRLLRPWAPALRGWALVAGTGLAIVALVQGSRAPEVASYDVTLPSLARNLDGKVIVAVSDTHLGTQLGAAWLAARAGEIEALRPDAVVFVGDIFEGHGAQTPEVPALSRLSPPLGKWFVDGNHESHRGPNRGVAVLERAGFRHLANESAVMAPGLVIAGVSDLTSHRRRQQDGDPLGEALASRPAGTTVLLSHTPWQAERAAAAGVGLMLSGHTHGGQIWPFGYLVKAVYPLLAGRYDVGGMPVIVGRGTGTWGPRMRLWKRGEIVKVTLHAARPATAA